HSFASRLEQRGMTARRDWQMSQKSAIRPLGRTLGTILSIATIGAAISLGSVSVRAEDNNTKDKNVTEDQIVRALVPEKKPPLTRGLSVGPQQTVDPAKAAAEN